MKHFLRLLLIAAAGLALAGCGSTGKFDNLITLSLTGDRAFVSSLYGPVGITAELRAADAQELKRMAEAARMAEQMALVLRLQAAQPPKGP